MADLLIGYLQNIALHVIDHMKPAALLHEEAVHAALQMPMFEDNWETHASRCQIDFDFKALVTQDQVSCHTMLICHTRHLGTHHCQRASICKHALAVYPVKLSYWVRCCGI